MSKARFFSWQHTTMCCSLQGHSVSPFESTAHIQMGLQAGGRTSCVSECSSNSILSENRHWSEDFRTMSPSLSNDLGHFWLHRLSTPTRYQTYLVQEMGVCSAIEMGVSSMPCRSSDRQLPNATATKPRTCIPTVILVTSRIGLCGAFLHHVGVHLDVEPSNYRIKR